MTGIKAFLLLAVSALHLAVVTGSIGGAGRLVADIEHGGGLLEEEGRCRLQLENRIASALVPAAALCPSALR